MTVRLNSQKPVRRLTVSNTPNEAIMERLYDEAYEELRIKYEDEYALHSAAVDLAKKRFEFDYA